ncbi:hypothetical protein chiPu_0031446, partial [Chiloscyllium punctatum]|nr:hypothetical protein [Chiloscyllium punctatum]
FGEAFWNSSKYGMVNYLLRMMTSWAVVCSVWYLPPMTRECVCVRERMARRLLRGDRNTMPTFHVFKHLTVGERP